MKRLDKFQIRKCFSSTNERVFFAVKGFGPTHDGFLEWLAEAKITYYERVNDWDFFSVDSEDTVYLLLKYNVTPFASDDSI